MARTVPGDVFFDTGTGNPMSKGLQAHGVTREREDNLIAVAVFRLTYQSQKSVVKRDDNSTDRAMYLGFALLELKQLV